MEELDIVLGAVSVGTGHPMERCLEKVTVSGYLCGYCDMEGHSKLACTRLNSHCSTCGLKGQNYTTYHTELTDEFTHAYTDEHISEEPKIKTR